VLKNEADNVRFREKLADLAALVGGEYYAYILVTNRDGVEAYPPALLTNNPPTWVELYIAKNYDLFDPVYRYAFDQVFPFSWREVTRVLNRPDVSGFFADAAQHGLVDGVTTPLRGPARVSAILSIAASSRSSEIIARIEAERHTFFTSAYELHVQIEDAHWQEGARAADQEDVTLTRRQVEVLDLRSQGKSVQEIAIILEISPKTVENTLRDIRSRLGFDNTASAVAKAASMRLILPVG